jgi:aspartyl protease family protein
MPDAMTFAELLDFLRDQPLLGLAIVAIFITIAGGMMRRPVPWLGRLLQGAGNLGLVAALLLTIAQVTRLTTSSDLALPQLGMPKQSVEGGETRIPMSGDGHFWVTAEVDGTPARFLVDTGATITAISEDTAIEARVPQKAIRQTVNMRTANGAIRAELATIGELRLGNIVARDLDAVVAPGLGDTNVIGMNLLSRLKSWRVEDNTLILAPNIPQQAVVN